MGARVAGREARGATAVWWCMAWRTVVGGADVSATPLYRLYDVVDGAARLGCVALVVDERLVRGGGLLSVERLARSFCSPVQPGSASVPAVRTLSGRFPRLVSLAARCACSAGTPVAMFLVQAGVPLIAGVLVGATVGLLAAGRLGLRPGRAVFAGQAA